MDIEETIIEVRMKQMQLVMKDIRFKLEYAAMILDNQGDARVTRATRQRVFTASRGLVIFARSSKWEDWKNMRQEEIWRTYAKREISWGGIYPAGLKQECFRWGSGSRSFCEANIKVRSVMERWRQRSANERVEKVLKDGRDMINAWWGFIVKHG